MTTANTATNPTTGVEYYTDGDLERQSVKLYVPVVNGQALRPSGVRWPVGGGGVHDEAADYYERVELTPVPFDPKIFKIDNATSGWGLHPRRNAEGEFVAVPDGHPKGVYKETQNVVRRSMDELKTLVRGYCDGFNLQIWQRLPQDIWSTERLAWAKDQIAKGNNLNEFVAVVQDDALLREKLVAASLHNDARLAQLYAEIEAAEDKAITSAVATTTAATLTFDVAHGIVVGKRIAVKDLPAPFARLNGRSFEVTAVTTSSPFTLSYDLTGAAIATAVVTAGVVTPAIDFIADQMSTFDANGQQLAGWVNGIPE